MRTRVLAIAGIGLWLSTAAAITAAADQPPSMSSIQVVFERPTTTYSVTISGADPQSFQFDRTKQQTNPCGTFTQGGHEATWSHPDASLGSITRACTAGNWVVTGRFRVFRIGAPVPNPSDWFVALTKEDLGSEVRRATARARAENDRVAKQVLAWKTHCDARGCGSAAVGPPFGDPKPPGNY